MASEFKRFIPPPTIKNFYTATNVQPGDCFVCVVTCLITDTGYRLYRCEYPPRDTFFGIPQGGRAYETKPYGVAGSLFPILKILDIQESK